ncbi:hypothetical protein H1R20_g2664, partial [Candolleomyces eurysporus]
MSEFTHSTGRENRVTPADNPERNTPIQSRAATPGADANRTPSKARGFRVWMGENYDKGRAKVERGVQKVEKGVKSLLNQGNPKNEGEGETSPQYIVGVAASGQSDNANIEGRLSRDGEAAGEMGAVDTLASGAGVTTLAAEEALEVPAEFETGQKAAPFLPQPHAAYTSAAEDEHTPSPETAFTSIAPKLFLDEDKAATIEDTLVAMGVGSGAVRQDDNSLATVAGEPEPDAMGAVSLAHSAETVPPPTPANNLQGTVSSGIQPQATLLSVATDDDSNPLQKTVIASTILAPVLAEEKGGDHTLPEGIEGPPVPAPEMVRSAMNESTAFKNALGIAIAIIPEAFKGPAEALLKVMDVIEKVDSNEEEVEILKKRCDLLRSSLVNAVKGKDTKFLSEDLKDSIGRLVMGLCDTLEAANQEKSKGVAAYVLAEDNIEILKHANKKLDELLQCFWIENHIAGTVVLSDILATVQDQGGWMQGLSVNDKHFENAALDQLKRVYNAAYDSQKVANKIVSCLEGTCSTLLANIGHWMSGSISDGHNTPLYVLDGIAGVGKSTVAMTVAQRAAGINSLGATFFFSRDQENRNNASCFVQTIAYQLACYDTSYGRAIGDAITCNPEALGTVLTQQFNLLVAKPLCLLLEQRATPLVLLF